eukprot:12938612-Prorocentrum_lima.AAC.1
MPPCPVIVLPHIVLPMAPSIAHVRQAVKRLLGCGLQLTEWLRMTVSSAPCSDAQHMDRET